MPERTHDHAHLTAGGALPFVSVIIPALNCLEEIEPCLDALANQDYPRDRYEVIVVDNGSTDGTLERLEQTWAKVHVREERGRARALNTGLEHAEGDIICTTDMSCRAEPHWIRTIVESFDDPTVGCVAGEIRLFKTGGENPVIGFQERVNYMSPMQALNRTHIPFLPFADGANACFRKKVFTEIGGFEESFIKGADVEICYRLFALTNYKIVFDYRARVWEPGEATLRALLKQRLRIGIGWNLMRMKYPLLYEAAKFSPPCPKSGLKSVYWSIRATLDNIARLLLLNAFALFGERRESAYDANVRTLMGWVQDYGRFYGRWYLRSLGIRPVALDVAAQQRLLNVGSVLDRVVVRYESPIQA